MPSKIVESHDCIQVTTIQTLYKTKKVKDKVIEEYVNKEYFYKEIKVKRWCRKENIPVVQEYINSRNQVSKVRCMIYDRSTNTFHLLDHSPEQVIEAIERKNKIGFNGSSI